MKKTKFVDKLMIAVVVILMSALALANLFQGQRPTHSEQEKRPLATMPEFSVSALLDGSYFEGLDAYFADTFLGREGMVSVSKKMDMYKSLSVIYERKDSITVIQPPAPQTSGSEDTVPTLPPITTKPPATSSSTSSIPEPSTGTGPTDPSVTETTQPTQPPVIPLSNIPESIKLDEGSTRVLQAKVGEGYGNLTWKTDKPDYLQLSDSKDDSIVIKGLKTGSAMVTVSVTNEVTGEVHTLACLVTIATPAIKPPDQGGGEFLPNGMIIYNGAAYTQSFYNSYASQNLANIYERYAQLFPDSKVSVVVAPLATITIKDEKILANVQRQELILNKIQADIKGNVNFVNLGNTFLDHSDEYLFFKSDHHWTHRGAYYAYRDFAQSVGLTPTPIEDFQVKILNQKYIGSMHYYTGDDRVKEFYDTIEAYIPTKSCTMTIYDYRNGQTQVQYYNSCVLTGFNNYIAFIGGDHGYTVINVPDNPQDKTCVVIKDSYGDAFVPYLTEHYGNIYVIDPRYSSIDMLEQFGENPPTDIIFMLCAPQACNNAWYGFFYDMIT